MRSLEILEALADGGEQGIVEIAARTGLRPSTAHRLLATLVARGYAVQARPSGRYVLGYRLAELAGAVGERSERVRALARPHLAAICEATGESANLSVLAPPDAVYVDHVDGTHAVRMSASIGVSVPAHASAAGKAMLARVPDANVAQLVGGEPLRALTERTITTLADLRRELDGVRERGYAIDDEEHEPGVGCVAAPILDPLGGAVAALSVSAPAPRIEAAGRDRLGHLLVRHATRIARELATG